MKYKREIAFMELFLMIVASISFSYIVGSSYENPFEPKSLFLSSFFSKLKEPLFKIVSASSEGCCSLSTDGGKCITASQEKCSGDFAAGAYCESTSFCVKGCCYDESKGIFDKNVLKSDCKKSWSSDSNCNLPGAEKGCCVLDGLTVYETEGQCKTDTQIRSSLSEVDFRKDVDEYGCVLLSENQEEGACVFNDGSCTFVTEANCLSYNGRFYSGYLCTSEKLNTSCEKTTQTTCVDGKDGVYFVDSCGNIANIYDSSKIESQSYWEKVFSSEESCGSGEGNENSKSCGNCDRLLGGMCSSAEEDDFNVNEGDFYCRPTGCTFKGETYENGESWCVYDGSAGNGTDLVGSRHWRYVCSYGEVQVEPCEDYRNEVCLQSTTTVANEDYSVSSCIENTWFNCLTYNEETDSEKLVEKCNANPLCTLKNINVDKYFHFDYCSPAFPPGFDVKSEDTGENGQEVCSTGTQTCTVVYVKEWDTGWDCQANCDCETAKFTEEMNDFCTSLGDCGAYPNIVEEVTDDGYSVLRAPKLGKTYLEFKELLSSEKDISFKDILTYPLLAYTKTNSSANFLSSLGTVGGLGSLAHTAKGSAESDLDTISTVAGAIGTAYFLFIMEFASMFGAIGAVVGLAVSLIALFAGIGDTKKKYVTFTCKPWQPPVGGEDCEECNGDPLKPCSEYRCQSLGAACALINKGTDNELCIHENPSDVTPPLIEPKYDALSEDLQYNEVSDSGFKITTLDGSCPEAYTELAFGIVTNEPAQCKFNIGNSSDFSSMEYDFGSNLYEYNHTATFSLPDPSHGQSLGLNITDEITLYVKCRDTNGYENPTDYIMEMCVKEGPDKTAPVVRAISPESGTLVGYNATSQALQVVTNELSTCRWSTSESDYSSMGNEMACDDDLENPSSIRGYLCSATLPIKEDENTYYIRCMDQPWLNGSGNANSQSTIIVLSKPDEPITIESVEPSEDFESSTEYSSIELVVKTSGGGQNHICSYSLTGYEKMIEFFETGSGTTHTQPLNLLAGKNKIYVECIDETGDSSSSYTDFKIDFDGSSPQIIRLWRDSSYLHIITNEGAVCDYSLEDCNFGVNKTYYGKLTHSFELNLGEKYFIKCKDVFGNSPPGCTTTVFVVG